MEATEHSLDEQTTAGEGEARNEDHLPRLPRGDEGEGGATWRGQSHPEGAPIGQ